MLLAPESMPPEDYLRQLAVTAQLVRTEATVQALVAAETPQAAVAALLAAVRADVRPDESTAAPVPVEEAASIKAG